MMPSHISTDALTEADPTRRDDQGTLNRYTDLDAACLRISASLETETVLQSVIDNARWLTNARYGVLLAFTGSGAVENIFTSGTTAGEFQGVQTPPQGKGLLGYLNEVQGPLRVADIASHPKSAGLPEGHPPMRAFLGMPIRRDGIHLGNIYLAETERGEEFTSDDEDIIVRFAAHAGNAISNARKFESERRIKTDLKALVDISPIAVLVFDAKTGMLLAANRENQRMVEDLRLPGGSWERMPEVVSFRRADGRELPFSDLPSTRVMQSGETVRAEEIEICLPSGRTITALVNAAPIYSDRGEIVSVVVAMQDMTPHHDAERMRAELLGLVSQELRTPLSAIKGSIVALSDIVSSINSTEPLHLLQIIDHQADLMRSQINRLTDLSDLEFGTLQINLEPTDVKTLVTGAIREFGRNHPGQEFLQDIPPDLPNVMMDVQRIDHVLRDLFAHSFKHYSETDAITVSARRQDLQVVFTISTHIDCAHSHQPPQVFKRLLEGHPERAKDNLEGDGLALSISKGIVNAHGGRLQAKRGEANHGMEFTFTIPIAADADDSAPSIFDRQAEPSGRPVGEKPRILLVVDDPHILGITRRTLSRADYTPLASFDLDDIEQLVASENPDLVLFDLSNSEPKEFDVMDRIVNSHRVPTIAILDPGDEAGVILAFDKGADGYIVKPFSPTELLARIRSSLRRKALSHRSDPHDAYALGDLRIDYTSHIVTVAGQPAQLTATEYKLLHELSSSAGRVMTQDELLHRVWGPEYTGESQLLRAYVKTLRQKLGDNARKPSYIFTEHGIGYRMAKP